MIAVNIHDAKTHLSSLLKRVSAGEDVIISKSGHPLAKLTRISAPAAKREGGFDRGLFSVPEDFDEECDEIIRMFGGTK